jgi:MFS family permease
MTRGFGPLVGAQFLSALADNALLVIAIALLDRLGASAWMTPMLKFVFIGSFVVFAVGVGAFADALPKAHVMLITNAVKGGGCLLMLAGAHPLVAYALIGLGAAAYSPAKYGLLTELMPPERLVAANAWLEGLTIGSVIFGTVLGGLLVGPEFAQAVGDRAGRDAGLHAATATAFGLYFAASLVNLAIPDTGRRSTRRPTGPADLVRSFAIAFARLSADGAARVALLATSVLWGAGAALQFIVIDWGRHALQLPLDRAAMLPGLVAVGVAVGAGLAARQVRLARAFSILPLGLLFGPLLIALLPMTSVPAACALLLLLGTVAGAFLVPMNAMFQHRGSVLTNAGQAIAVQNFCENLGVMTMVATYAALLGSRVPLNAVVIGLGLAVSLALLALLRHALNHVRSAGSAGAAESNL